MFRIGFRAAGDARYDNMRDSATSISHQSGPTCLKGLDLVWLPDLLWALPFLVLYWIDLAHHQLWRDELNAWFIAALSPTLPALSKVVHYEGHPWLWYYVLWLPSRLSTAPVLMKCVEAAIGTAVYLLLFLKSPFTRWERVLIASGYFFVFEYMVMSRMYSLMLLCALLYAWRRSEKPGGAVGIAAILGAMASTDMTGVLLSGALLIGYAYECWERRGAWSATGLSAKRLAWAAALYTGLLAISIVSLLPAKDISWQGGKLFFWALQPGHILRTFVNATAAPWWPISKSFPHRFWDTDFKDTRWLGLVAPVVLFAYWHTFRRDRGALLTIGLTIVFATGFADAVYVGHVRNWGITLLAFLVALWLLRARSHRKAGPLARLPLAAYGLLAVSAVAGVLATASTWARPFSHSADAAEWLRAHHLSEGVLTGAPDVTLAAVAEQLRRPVYFMECACTGSFKLFSHSRDTFMDYELPDKLVTATENLHTQSLTFITYKPLAEDQQSALANRSLQVTLLATFAGAEAVAEDYYIYRVTQTGPR